MIEGYNIVQLDPYNDVGYYSAKVKIILILIFTFIQAPLGVSNRDFVNQRSWRVAPENKEFIIMNHSVIHPNAPEKKGFVRYDKHEISYFSQGLEYYDWIHGSCS